MGPVTESIKARLRDVRSRLHVRQSRQVIAELIGCDNPRVSIIGRALRDTARKQESMNVADMLSKIEKRRDMLLNSAARIEVIDYGAGSPDANRADAEMEGGVVLSLPVSRICRASKAKFWALFLYQLVRHLNPKNCLELGTCVGISAAYIASALKLNDGGTLTTLEGSPQIADLAKETLESLDLENVFISVGPFHKTYKTSLEGQAPVDLLFNDGHHDYQAMLRYYFDALPHMREGGVIVFDDIYWSSGTAKAWTQIADDACVGAAVDLRSMGIAVTTRHKKNDTLKFSVPL